MRAAIAAGMGVDGTEVRPTHRDGDGVFAPESVVATAAVPLSPSGTPGACGAWPAFWARRDVGTT